MAKKQTNQVAEAPELHDGVVKLPVRAGERIDLSAYTLSEVKTEIQGDDLLLELPFNNFVELSDFFDYLEHPNPPRIIFKDYPKGLVPESWFDQSQIGTWLNVDGTSSESISQEAGPDNVSTRAFSVGLLELGRDLDLADLELNEIIPLRDSINIPPDNNGFLASLFVPDPPEDLGFPIVINHVDLRAENGADGSIGTLFLSNRTLGGFYAVVSGGGDINGDGLDDIAISSATASNNGITSGRGFVILGQTNFGPEVDLRSLLPINGGDGSAGFAIEGFQFDETLGQSNSISGDFNGDGLADVVFGAPEADGNGVPVDAGRAVIVFGSEPPFIPQRTNDEFFAINGGDGSQAVTFNGENASDIVGIDVGNLGDFNGDGIDDLAVGTGFLANLPIRFGGAAVLFGQTEPFDIEFGPSSLDGTNGFSIFGLNNDQAIGFTVSGFGDVNHDGNQDLIIGASNVDIGPNANAGQVYIIFGQDAGFGATFDLNTLFSANGGNGTTGMVINGLNAEDNLGSRIHLVPDINNDGIDDIIVGAMGADIGADLNAGRVYVIFGQENFPAEFDLSVLLPENGADGSKGFIINGTEANQELATDISNAGDINGDGIQDFLISAAGFNAPGQGYIIFGQTSFSPVLDLTALTNFTGVTVNGAEDAIALGLNVSAAGDVNGDGFDDALFQVPLTTINGVLNGGQGVLIYGDDFSNKVTHQGTENNDTLVGTAKADIIVSGLGNDRVISNGGLDVIKTALGDDRIEILNLMVKEIDGGGGFDELVLLGSEINFDFTNINAGSIENVESINADNGIGNVISLDVESILDLTQGTLTLMGDNQDSVVADLQGSNFTDDGLNAGFQQFSNNLVTLLIEDGVDTSGIII